MKKLTALLIWNLLIELVCGLVPVQELAPLVSFKVNDKLL